MTRKDGSACCVYCPTLGDRSGGEIRASEAAATLATMKKLLLLLVIVALATVAAKKVRAAS